MNHHGWGVVFAAVQARVDRNKYNIVIAREREVTPGYEALDGSGACYPDKLLIKRKMVEHC